MGNQGISEDTIKFLCEKYERNFSEHFINFAFRGHKFDFNVFKTQEEWDTYRKDAEYFQQRTKDTK